MSNCITRRKRAPFFRRKKLQVDFDIARLRPKSLPKGKRFETLPDALCESERSEILLRSFHTYSRKLANTLRDCREGDIICDRPHCPRCARRFRRFFIGQLLKLADETAQRIDIVTVLLDTADRDSISDLDPKHWKHALRKRLDRAGLDSASVVGGYEMAYRQAQRSWVLHANLVIFGARNDACLQRFETTFKGKDFYRPTVRAALSNPPRQLSYVLKFCTYHRPFTQRGPDKGVAVPLNAREHHALVEWMADRPFKDYVFFFNAEQRGPKMRFRACKNRSS